MKSMIAFTSLLVLMTAPLQAQDNPASKPESALQKSSYAVGLNMGRNLIKQGLDVDSAMLFRGIHDGLKGNESAMSEQELEETMIALEKMMRAKQAEKQIAANPALNEIWQKNKKEGTAFLAANGKKEGVQTTKTGLQYLVLKSGDGAMPKATDSVKTHYHGTLVDGTVFDSSVERNQPASFGVTQVISGWTEALQLMHVGDKWRLFLPADLAYGLTPRPGGKIGPGAVLIFEIELLDINK